MSTTKYFAFLAAAFMMLTSCSSDAPDTPADNDTPMRTLTVKLEPLSRTSIDYDNADVSHLVWTDGDKVAYISDVPGDVCREATVNHNRFDASVPASAVAGTNKIHIVYPVADNVGKTMAQLKATVNPSVSVVAAESFDGTLLPMTSEVTVTKESEVSAKFDYPASVIRLGLEISDSHDPAEVLQKVTLEANENLAGTYTLGSNGAWTFAGNSKKIETTVTGENASLVTLKKKDAYIYIVTNRSNFTGVDLTVTTSAGTYSFTDGTMNLAVEGATLYRTDVTISEPDPKVDPAYRKVTSTDQLTFGNDDKYLIVCEGKGIAFCSPMTTNFHEGVNVGIPADGIPATESAIQKLTFTLTPGTGNFEGRYLLNCPDISPSKGSRIKCMSNFSATPAKIAFSKLDPSTNGTFYWGISFDAEGNVKLQAHPDTQDVAGDLFMGVTRNAAANSTYFCIYGPDATDGQITPIQLYKLMQ